MNITELIGYLGSLLVAVSLSMKSVWRLRWINLFGSSFFAIYGYLIGALPILIVNSYIAITNVWYIVDYSRNAACLSSDSVKSLGENYFQRFYNFYEDDIRAFFPEVSFEQLMKTETSILFRNMIPVGIFSINPTTDRRAQVVMDYLIPEFRDLRFGKFIYMKKAYVFRDRKIEILDVLTEVKAHKNYLIKLGFKVKETNKNGSWKLEKKI